MYKTSPGKSLLNLRLSCIYRTVSKSVEIPERVHMAVATRGEMLKHLQRIAECRLRKAGSDMVSPLNHYRYPNAIVFKSFVFNNFTG